ncbi:hypothetical protein ACB098_04G069800 [Castanea mollissima]
MVKLRLKRCGKKQLKPLGIGKTLSIKSVSRRNQINHLYDFFDKKKSQKGEGRALWKVGFYDSIKNQTYLNVLAILYFLERGAHPIGTIHGISKKAGVFMELCLNQQIIFN